jgi:hypothetical protein
VIAAGIAVVGSGIRMLLRPASSSAEAEKGRDAWSKTAVPENQAHSFLSVKRSFVRLTLPDLCA